MLIISKGRNKSDPGNVFRDIRLISKGVCLKDENKVAVTTTTVTLEEQQLQHRQLTTTGNNGTAVAGDCLDGTAKGTIISSTVAPFDSQPFFPLSSPPKEKFKLTGGTGATAFPKRQSRRTVTVLDSSCRTNSAENDRYQLSRQDASVSHARRSPLGRFLF
uniref:DUF4005 domain-containing protein n=1 Tax=Setaria digitata TaxID=48799 RepID=A0A915Q4N6_9BILA